MRDEETLGAAQAPGAAAAAEQQAPAGRNDRSEPGMGGTMAAGQTGQAVQAGQTTQTGQANQAGASPQPAAGHDTLLKPGADPEAEAAQADGELQAQRQRLEADYKKQWSQTVRQWRQQAQDDPHIGGNNLPTTVARAQQALNQFDPDGTLGGWLAESGYGNHPEVLRFFNRIADAMAEDGVVQGRGTSERLPLEERMYGHWNP